MNECVRCGKEIGTAQQNIGLGIHCIKCISEEYEFEIDNYDVADEMAIGTEDD